MRELFKDLEILHHQLWYLFPSISAVSDTSMCYISHEHWAGANFKNKSNQESNQKCLNRKWNDQLAI